MSHHQEYRRMCDWLPQVLVEGPPVERTPCSGCTLCAPPVAAHLQVGYQLFGVWSQDIHAGRVTKAHKDHKLPYWIVKTDTGGLWHLDEYTKVYAKP